MSSATRQSSINDGRHTVDDRVPQIERLVKIDRSIDLIQNILEVQFDRICSLEAEIERLKSRDHDR